jgi:hypothetical protein
MHSLNFNETLLKHGIERIVNGLEENPRRPPLRRVPRVKLPLGAGLRFRRK